MPTGIVAPDGRPLIGIEVAGQAIDAIIDTGFECGLQLPDHWLPVLNPQPLRRVTYQFSDGHIDTKTTYSVQVTIDSVSSDAETYFSSTDEVLIGVDLLRHFRLTIDWPAGTVSLERPSP